MAHNTTTPRARKYTHLKVRVAQLDDQANIGFLGKHVHEPQHVDVVQLLHQLDFPHSRRVQTWGPAAAARLRQDVTGQDGVTDGKGALVQWLPTRLVMIMGVCACTYEQASYLCVRITL